MSMLGNEANLSKVRSKPKYRRSHPRLPATALFLQKAHIDHVARKRVDDVDRSAVQHLQEDHAVLRHYFSTVQIGAGRVHRLLPGLPYLFVAKPRVAK